MTIPNGYYFSSKSTDPQAEVFRQWHGQALQTRLQVRPMVGFERILDVSISTKAQEHEIQALLSPVPLRTKLWERSLCGHSHRAYWYLGSQQHLSQVSFNQGHAHDREWGRGSKKVMEYHILEGHTCQLDVCALLGLSVRCDDANK